MRTFNLSELYSILMGTGLRRALNRGPDANKEGTATTIRLSAEARNFFEGQAEALGGISLSAALAIALEGVMRATMADESPAGGMREAINLMRDRLLHVYRAHDLDPTHLVEFLAEDGFSLDVLRDDERFLRLLTEPVLNRTAQLFHVERDWLAGRAARATSEAGQWYKSLNQLPDRLRWLTEQGVRHEVICLRREGADFEQAYEKADRAREERIGLLLQMDKTTPSGHRFRTYEVWEAQRWNYQKCRLYFKSLLVLLKNSRTAFRGVELPVEVLRNLYEGRILPVEAMKAKLSGCAWYPDDYIDPPTSQVAKETDELPLVSEKLKEAGYFCDDILGAAPVALAAPATRGRGGRR